MVLCVGPSGSGKTLLLKRLQNSNFQIQNYCEIPPTVTTVGTNIIYMKDKSKTIIIQEVGGSMADIWDQYYSDSHSIIYVIDSTNLSKIGESCIRLFQMMSDHNVKHLKPILIVLNKSDVNCISSKQELRYLLMIDELKATLPNQKIDILECSCVTGIGLDLIHDWIHSNN